MPTNRNIADITIALIEQIKTSRIEFAGEESPVEEILSFEEEEKVQTDESDSEDESESQLQSTSHHF